MSQSKRFVIVSFFVTLALSALCQSAYGVISAFAEEMTLNNGMKVLYAIGLACFLIKYFIDDVVDDNGGTSEVISRRSLASLIIGWMLFLFAAISAGTISVSAIFWFIGILVITLFMVRNKSTIPVKCFWRYLGENIFLGMVLLGLSLQLLFTVLAECLIFTVCVTMSLFLVNIIAFVVMLSDGTPEIKG